MIKQEKPGGKISKQLSLKNLFLLTRPVVISISHELMDELKAKHGYMMMHLKARKNEVVSLLL